jgi:fibronectin-binding autotransporter adhesin
MKQTVTRRFRERLRGSVVAAAIVTMTLGLNLAPAYSQFSCTASAGTAIWNISGSGNWDVQGNWLPSTEVPDSSTTRVCILNSGATTVTLNTYGLASMDDLTINKVDTLSVSGGGAFANVYGTSIENAGNIDLGNSSTGNALQLGANGDVTLSGGGTITMTAPSGSSSSIGNLGHSSNTFDNVDNTIQGNGNIEVTGLVNEDDGIIDATTASGENTTLLMIASGGATNTGLMEATTGMLVIQSTTVANGDGEITANGGTVELNAATIQGGTLNAINGGTMENTGNGAVLDGSTSEGSLTINGNYTAGAGGEADINGVIVNKGNFLIDGVGGFFTQLLIGSPGATENYATLEGGGAVTLFETSTADVGPAQIETLSGAATLENVNNTIQGNGNIGSITLINDSGGVIDATTGSGQQNTLTLESSASITNAGLMEASSGAELLIQSPTDNDGGNITANGGTVVVENTITGGLLSTKNGGTMESGTNAALDSVTISTGTTYVTNGIGTGILGTITNGGTILNNDGGSLGVGTSDTPNATLQGGGTVTLAWSSGGAQTNISAASGGNATLTNVNNTIRGNGLIGVGYLTLVNDAKGVIDATAAAGLNNTLTLDTVATTNQGLMEASSGAELLIQSPVTNTGGNITANGGTVVVENTITGGTLNTVNGGTMESEGYVALDGSTSAGAVTISKGSTYTFTASEDNVTDMKGTITNEGTFRMIGGGEYGVALDLESSVTLNGGGTLTLDSPSGQPDAYIQQVVGGLTLTNVNNTIKGNGNIGNVSGMDVVNDSGGTIEATTASGQTTTLTLDSGTLTNNGTLGADAGTTLHVQNPGVLTNFNSGTLTGGTYDANGTIQVDSLGSSGGEIVTNNANIILNGASGGAAALLDSAGKNALSALATNKGSFTIENGGNAADFKTAGNFTNDGTLTVGSGSKFDVNGNLTNFSSSTDTLTGGTYNVTGTLQFNGANIKTNAASITLTGTSSQIVNQTGGNGLANLATNASTGSFSLEGGRTLTTAGNFTNNGKLTVGSGSSFTVGGTGTTLTQAAGTTTVAGSLTTKDYKQSAGTTQVNSGGTLTATTAYSQSSGTGDVNGTLISPSVSLTGGTLEGAGTIEGSKSGAEAVVSLTGAGLDPGHSLSVFGSVGLASSDTWTEDVDSLTSFGALDVKGTPGKATITGTLDIDLPDGYGFLTNGKEFVILDATGGRSGTFTKINGLDFGTGDKDSWTVGYTADEVTLTANIPADPALMVAADPGSATPEPGSLLLFGTGLLLLGWAVKKRGLMMRDSGEDMHAGRYITHDEAIRRP